MTDLLRKDTAILSKQERKAKRFESSGAEADPDAGRGAVKFFGMKKSLVTETDRPLAFVFHVIATIAVIVPLVANFWQTLPTKPAGFFLQLSTWASLLSFPYFVFASFHTLPLKIMKKPASGYLSRLIFTEKTQIILLGLAWCFSVMACIMYFSTEYTHDKAVQLTTGNSVVVISLVNVVPVFFQLLEVLFFTKIALQHTHLVVLIPVTLFYCLLKGVYMSYVADSLTNVTTPPTGSTYLQFLAIVLGSVVAFYLAWIVTYIKYKERVGDQKKKKKKSPFVVIDFGDQLEDDDDEEDEEAAILHREAADPDSIGRAGLDDDVDQAPQNDAENPDFDPSSQFKSAPAAPIYSGRGDAANGPDGGDDNGLDREYSMAKKKLRMPTEANQNGVGISGASRVPSRERRY